MSDEMQISLTITPTWSILRDIREQTEEYMKSKGGDIDIIEATIMCSSELIENAIKYGSEKPDGSNITFDLNADDEKIDIRVSNGIKDDADIRMVIEHIDKVKESGDPAQLYTDRLMELMENPKPGISQLGLFRIAYEGEFSLDYTFENNVLTVIAERRL